MKIESFGRPESPLVLNEKRGSLETSSAKGGFQAVLGQARSKQEVSELWAAMEEQAERLKKRQDLLELRRYQEQVRRFLQYVLGGAFKLKEDLVRDRRGRQKCLTIVALVDAHLEELAALFIQAEKDRIAILEKIDQIRGLLLDFYS